MRTQAKLLGSQLLVEWVKPYACKQSMDSVFMRSVTDIIDTGEQNMLAVDYIVIIHYWRKQPFKMGEVSPTTGMVESKVRADLERGLEKPLLIERRWINPLDTIYERYEQLPRATQLLFKRLIFMVVLAIFLLAWITKK